METWSKHNKASVSHGSMLINLDNIKLIWYVTKSLWLNSTQTKDFEESCRGRYSSLNYTWLYLEPTNNRQDSKDKKY
jgi:hypothetical protein